MEKQTKIQERDIAIDVSLQDWVIHEEVIKNRLIITHGLKASDIASEEEFFYCIIKKDDCCVQYTFENYAKAKDFARANGLSTFNHLIQQEIYV